MLCECDYKSNDGHKLYHVKCCECGWETDMQLRHIKRAKICVHKTLGDVYINTDIIWQNKRIGNIFPELSNFTYFWKFISNTLKLSIFMHFFKFTYPA